MPKHPEVTSKHLFDSPLGIFSILPFPKYTYLADHLILPVFNKTKNSTIYLKLLQEMTQTTSSRRTA